ncbi:uncharacterized protein LOC125239113 [Leguminivora glycinivorella]|uniref:uncharacterized protein LOC125239113 n=1 Tax=Leguminivora glycinivorella TaxID=1035111 RepID=UPI00200F05EB|nr:uncharacterized protein LOC125239113 [Leguminivora glycinivorella]XP_048002563.1 uncharacterized protein LOC125239113 [Leguminivora glycinivorella]
MQRKMSQRECSFLSVTLNVDGLPIHSSTTHSFWPILCILDQSPDKQPFIVALYYGQSKPNNAAVFLRPFVEECLRLEQNGLYVNGVKFEFRVSCIIADAPARAFIKCIKSHNSLHACEKCQQEGVYIGRTVWPYSSELSLRTDIGFVNQEYEDHQILKSILTELDVGLVTQVPLDFMHLVCLGVVKKMIRCWIENGPKECKLNIRKIDEISRRLLLCHNHYPAEFSRRPRPLKLFKYWKATEFRAFVLYIGPVVLQKIFPNGSIYKHFMMLHCAIYILCSEDISQNDQWRSYADSLLHCFVKNSRIFYSEEFTVYNVHNLLHLAADVYNFGSLDLFSAFPFENFMSKIKRLVRSHNMPLEQVAKRLGEKSNYSLPQKTIPVKKQGGIIKKIPIFDNCVLSTCLGDSCFVTLNGDIVVIKKIKKCPKSDDYILQCNSFLNKSDFYVEPIESSKLGIYKVSHGTNRKNYLVTVAQKVFTVTQLL